MNNFIIIGLICVSSLMINSCKKVDTIEAKESTEIALIGKWQSIRVDSLIEYIVPVKDDSIHSCEYSDLQITFKSDGSFIRTEANDTIKGKWSLFKVDSLKFSNYIRRDKYLYDSKLTFIDNNTITLGYGFGMISLKCDSFFDTLPHQPEIIEHTIYSIKNYLIRKE